MKPIPSFKVNQDLESSARVLLGESDDNDSVGQAKGSVYANAPGRTSVTGSPIVTGHDAKAMPRPPNVFTGVVRTLTQSGEHTTPLPVAEGSGSMLGPVDEHSMSQVNASASARKGSSVMFTPSNGSRRGSSRRSSDLSSGSLSARRQHRHARPGRPLENRRRSRRNSSVSLEDVAKLQARLGPANDLQFRKQQAAADCMMICELLDLRTRSVVQDNNAIAVLADFILSNNIISRVRTDVMLCHCALVPRAWARLTMPRVDAVVV